LGEQAAALDYLSSSGWTATRRNPDVLIRAVVRLARIELTGSLQNYLSGASSHGAMVVVRA